MPTIEELARKAYAAYGATTGHKNFQGNPMPTWQQLPGGIRLAWRNATAAVYNAVQGKLVYPMSTPVDSQSLRECKVCGFLWPPAVQGQRCPYCGAIESR